MAGHVQNANSQRGAEGECDNSQAKGSDWDDTSESAEAAERQLQRAAERTPTGQSERGMRAVFRDRAA